MELRGGLCWSCWPNNQWTAGRTPSHNQNFLLLDLSGWRLLGQISCETHAQSTVMRVMHVKLPSICSWPLCRESGLAMRLRLYLDRSLAMCLLKPSSLPQCVLAYPMCLRNAILAYIQGVFAMRLRHPMRLHNASAPPNASARSNASES